MYIRLRQHTEENILLTNTKMCIPSAKETRREVSVKTNWESNYTSEMSGHDVEWEWVCVGFHWNAYAQILSFWVASLYVLGYCLTGWALWEVDSEAELAGRMPVGVSFGVGTHEWAGQGRAGGRGGQREMASCDTGLWPQPQASQCSAARAVLCQPEGDRPSYPASSLIRCDLSPEEHDPMQLGLFLRRWQLGQRLLPGRGIWMVHRTL